MTPEDIEEIIKSARVKLGAELPQSRDFVLDVDNLSFIEATNYAVKIDEAHKALVTATLEHHKNEGRIDRFIFSEELVAQGATTQKVDIFLAFSKLRHDNWGLIAEDNSLAIKAKLSGFSMAAEHRQEDYSISFSTISDFRNRNGADIMATVSLDTPNGSYWLDRDSGYMGMNQNPISVPEGVSRWSDSMRANCFVGDMDFNALIKDVSRSVETGFTGVSNDYDVIKKAIEQEGYTPLQYGALNR